MSLRINKGIWHFRKHFTQLIKITQHNNIKIILWNYMKLKVILIKL